MGTSDDASGLFASYRNLIAPHMDNRQHESGDQIAIGGFEFEVSCHEPCDLS
jgi:hypothetical protein